LKLGRPGQAGSSLGPQDRVAKSLLIPTWLSKTAYSPKRTTFITRASLGPTGRLSTESPPKSAARSSQGAILCEAVRRGAKRNGRLPRMGGRHKPLAGRGLCDVVRRSARLCDALPKCPWRTRTNPKARGRNGSFGNRWCNCRCRECTTRPLRRQSASDRRRMAHAGSGDPAADCDDSGGGERGHEESIGWTGVTRHASRRDLA